MMEGFNMEIFSTGASEVMRTVVSWLLLPVQVALLLLAAFALFYVGSVVFEFFTERRHFKVFLPKLGDDIKAAKSAQDIFTIVRDSGLLKRQKDCLIELTNHPQMDPPMIESMAVAFSDKEHQRYDDTVNTSNTISKISPMLGLLGTLIPLGPGILALSFGETEILSQSMTIAFDTCALGVLIAAIMLVISWRRKRWYRDYKAKFDAVMEWVVYVLKVQYEERQAAAEPPRPKAGDL
jgi:biopolymer transport protein ExbB/TolQ